MSCLLQGVPGAVRLAHINFLVVHAIGLVLIVATLVISAERGHDSELGSFPDALWWAIATMTTVGHGDVVPVMQVGRAFAYVLMLGRVGLIVVLTAHYQKSPCVSHPPADCGLTNREGAYTPCWLRPLCPGRLHHWEDSSEYMWSGSL